jgi:hypothetical protein
MGASVVADGNLKHEELELGGCGRVLFGVLIRVMRRVCDDRNRETEG